MTQIQVTPSLFGQLFSGGGLYGWGLYFALHPDDSENLVEAFQ